MVRLNWTLPDAKVGHNVMYWTYSGTPILSAAVAEQCRAALTNGTPWTGLATYLAPGVALASVTVLDVRSSSGIEYTSTGSASPGTSAGTALPDETAAVVTLRTGQRGPAGRGRIYVPGWSSTASGVAGVILAAAVTALQTWASNNLNVGMASIFPGGMVVAHPARQAYTSPATGREFPARAAGTVPVSSVTVRDNHWDSQRRRGLR